MNHLKWTVTVLAFAFAAALPAVSWADAAPTAPPAHDLADCFWSHVSDADKADYATTYHAAVAAGLSQHSSDVSDWLLKKLPDLKPVFARCDATPKIPRLLLFAFISSQFDQYGAFRELADNAQITRDELDQTWAKAPEVSRRCERAEAGMHMGGTDLTCPDTRANFWFINDLRTRHTLVQGRDTLMVITYMSAKARSEIAEEKIADFDKTGATTLR